MASRCAAEDAHGEIERATRRYLGNVGCRIVGDKIGNGQDGLRCGAPKGSKCLDRAPGIRLHGTCFKAECKPGANRLQAACKPYRKRRKVYQVCEVLP